VTGRYARQSLLPWIGAGGQDRIGKAAAAVVGVGALGGSSAGLLARAGVGRLILVDRDHVEESNLQRQVLFTERDWRERLPKVVAAERSLKEIRDDLEVEALAEDLGPERARDLFLRADVVLDGTDNFETRYLLNDAAVEADRPWIYGGAVASGGTVFAVRPGLTPCLRCLFPVPPAPGSAPTCDTAGILGPAAAVVGALQASEALKVLAGREDLCAPGLLTLDLQDLRVSRVSPPRDPECPCCGGSRSFDFLEERGTSRTHRLCGRDGVMVLAPKGTRLDLAAAEARLRPFGPVFRNPYLLQTEWEGHPVTLYADGRALIQKTPDPARARALYARYLGL
jgi:adenylyltransferase/sulfurtransferase